MENFTFRTRGEVALIMAGIGLAYGVLGPQEFGVTIMMTVLTTLVAPIFLVMQFAHPGSGTTKELVPEERSTFEFKFPSEEVTEIIYTNLLDAFENDGFYVHALDHDELDIYQLRQDDMIIELHHTKTMILFNCEKKDEHIVNSAVFEVSSDLRRMLDGLNKPIDQQVLQEKMSRSAKTSTKSVLDLSSFIPRNCIKVNLEAMTKEGIIAELLDLIVKHENLSGRDEILQALLDREKTISTGLQHGFALPHAKTNNVDRIVCALGIKRTGIDFGALDGQPSRIFVLELAPKVAAGPHLQFVSTITQSIQAHGDKLMSEEMTAEQIYELLRS